LAALKQADNGTRASGTKPLGNKGEMVMVKEFKSFAVGALVVASSLSVLAAVNLPHTFTANTPIKAEEVNANFSSLKASIEALQASVGAIPDGVVTPPKLATQNTVATGKYLSFDGSSLVWADGTAGTPGPKGDKGDTGLQGTAGTNGISGYVVVKKTFANTNLAVGSETVQIIDCPSGKKVVGGGGVVFNANGRWVTTSNGPVNETQWAVALANLESTTISAAKLEVSAICVTAL
jgi:hypothetical protein